MKKNFVKPDKISTQADNGYKIWKENCLNELNDLKFVRIHISFSNRCWKFQLPILKNKKVLFLKKYLFLRSRYKNKALFTDSTFREGFGTLDHSIGVRATMKKMHKNFFQNPFSRMPH